MGSNYKKHGIDPNNELSERILPDGDIEAKYKGEQIPYEKMIDEVEERFHRKQSGKSMSKKIFTGFKFKKEVNHG